MRAQGPRALAVFVSLALLPRVAWAHDGTVVVAAVVICAVYTGLLGAVAIAGFAVGRRAAVELGRKRVAQRAVIGVVLSFPFSFLALLLFIWLNEDRFFKQPGIPFWLIGPLVLQFGYVTLICLWIARSHAATSNPDSVIDVIGS